MRKTTFSADRLSDLEITTCILRRSPARSSSRSCSRSSTWWSSAAAIAAGVLLVLGLSAAAACDGGSDSDTDTETDTDDRDCEGFKGHYCACWPDACTEDSWPDWESVCVHAPADGWACVEDCDEGEVCDVWGECIGGCEVI